FPACDLVVTRAGSCEPIHWTQVAPLACARKVFLCLRWRYYRKRDHSRAGSPRLLERQVLFHEPGSLGFWRPLCRGRHSLVEQRVRRISAGRERSPPSHQTRRKLQTNFASTKIPLARPVLTYRCPLSRRLEHPPACPLD